jgi:hypothetical protein
LGFQTYLIWHQRRLLIANSIVIFFVPASIVYGNCTVMDSVQG